MKKHYLLIILIISLLFGTYNFFSLKLQKKAANSILITSLQVVQSCFSKDYTIMSNNEKNTWYITISSNLNTASHIINLTSCVNNENQNRLANTISELYFCMTEINLTNSKWKAVTEKSEVIYKYLTDIINNPNDEIACNSLSEIANNLRYDIKDVLINYKGISQNWTIDYKIDGTKRSHDTYYTFKYTGEGANLVKIVNYSIDSSNEGEDGKFIVSSNKGYAGKLRLTSGLPKPTDRDITVKMKWNTKEEVLILKRVR